MCDVSNKVSWIAYDLVSPRKPPVRIHLRHCEATSALWSVIQVIRPFYHEEEKNAALMQNA